MAYAEHQKNIWPPYFFYLKSLVIMFTTWYCIFILTTFLETWIIFKQIEIPILLQKGHSGQQWNIIFHQWNFRNIGHW